MSWEVLVVGAIVASAGSYVGLLLFRRLRLRGSWLSEQEADRNGTDFRVILRYDLPVI